MAASPGLLPADKRVGVAVSGGADSVALLVALAELMPTWQPDSAPIALHFVHSDSATDQAAESLVRALCGSLGFELEIARAGEARDDESATNDEEIADESEQMTARRLRYAFFSRAARTLQLDRIATAHTLEDQAETVVMRFASGHWLGGLAGIPTSRPLSKAQPDVLVARPMLDCPRVLARAYVDENGYQFVDDPGNLDPQDRRFQVRARVLPSLAELNPQVVANIGILAKQVSAASEAIDRIAERRVPPVSALERGKKAGEGQPCVAFDRAELGQVVDDVIAAAMIRIALTRLRAEPRRITHERCTRVVDAARAEGLTHTSSLIAGVSFRVTKREVLLLATGAAAAE